MNAQGGDKGHDKRRYERFEVHLPTQVHDEHGSYEATLLDVSEGGAAIHFDQPRYSNDQFVELHTAGYEILHGRVVREFSGGMALEFDDEGERRRARDELAKFRAIVGAKREL
jgi:hypothetical protein